MYSRTRARPNASGTPSAVQRFIRSPSKFCGSKMSTLPKCAGIVGNVGCTPGRTYLRSCGAVSRYTKAVKTRSDECARRGCGRERVRALAFDEAAVTTWPPKMDCSHVEEKADTAPRRVRLRLPQTDGCGLPLRHRAARHPTFAHRLHSRARLRIAAQTKR